MQYKAAKGKQNKVVVTRSGNTVTVDDKVAVKAGKGCKAVKGDKTKVRCTTKKAPTRVRVYTYDRNDSIVNKTGLATTADGGTGNDSITGGPPRGQPARRFRVGQALRRRRQRQAGGDAATTACTAATATTDSSTASATTGCTATTATTSSRGMEGNDKEYGGAGVDLFWETFDPQGKRTPTLLRRQRQGHRRLQLPRSR